MYSETYKNQSCSKAEILLRRTATFNPVYFLYASLSRISKAKSGKRTLLQTDSFSQSLDKKATCFTPKQMNILRISEKQRMKLDILVNFFKNIFFLQFKTTIMFFDSILQFWRRAILLSRNVYLFFQVALCNQSAIVLCHWKRYRTGTLKPYYTSLWIIGFSTVKYLSEALVKYQRPAAECTINLGDTFHYRKTYIRWKLRFFSF